MKITLYDKVAWHFPEGVDCPDLETAKRHFIVIMEWLDQHHYLSELGRELWFDGIDADFILTSEMVTSEGEELLDSVYEAWLDGIEYNGKISTALLEEHFKKST